MTAAADGTVTGMVDSDGDGVWTEEDCKLANGFFDAQTGVLSFDQVRIRPNPHLILSQSSPYPLPILT